MHQTIPEFYAGQKILVTGGTGFMGKVLVEKILRSCPDVERIYLIIREKKGKPIEQRWKEVTEKPLFNKLKAQRPENLKKIKLICGDLGIDKFGMSCEDEQELKENITIIFHVAADVQFSDSINDAILQNVKATKTMLDLAVSMINLKVFVYVSTAYSNHNKAPSEVVEKIFPSFQDWKVILKLQETEPKPLQLLKEKLLCGHPNPYTWSKSLAEQLIDEYSKYFPTVVMRPSVVIGCLREDPLVAWIDTLAGYPATAMGTFLGIVRVLKTKGHYHNDHIPVDIATRAELIAAKKSAELKSKISVYNGGTAKLIPLTFEALRKAAKSVEEESLVKEKVWVSDLWYIDNDYIYPIVFLYRQVMPAIFLDLLLKLFGHKPMFKKLAIKVANGNRIFSKFLNSEIAFPNKNFEALEEYLDESDKEQFSIDISDFLDKRDEIIRVANNALLTFLLNADLSKEGTEKHRPRFRRIKLLRKVLTILEYSMFGWLAWQFIIFSLKKLHIISFGGASAWTD